MTNNRTIVLLAWHMRGHAAGPVPWGHSQIKTKLALAQPAMSAQHGKRELIFVDL
jgi:hypothetical protein